MSDLAKYTTQASPTRKPLLIVSGVPPLHKKYTLASGTLLRGAVLGIVMNDTPVIAAGAGNTAGSGTIASATLGAGVKVGAYKCVCIEPASNAGQFELLDPDGLFVNKVTVAVAFTGPLNFTITDANDFVAGDHFTITVAETANVKLAVAAATDGSAIAKLVLIDDADASGAPVQIVAYTRADLNEGALLFGAGHTADTVRASLRARGIHLQTTLES